MTTNAKRKALITKDQVQNDNCIISTPIKAIEDITN